MIYRQRPTAVDDFLLQVLFPWLIALHATPLLRLARIWSEPVYPIPMSPGSPVNERLRDLWSKLTAWSFRTSIDGTYPQVKHEQSSVN